ncbi:MAG: D-tyrosyl-tRNA(Tyr) deacylase [Proteobacteria bacterium]|nr:D-tyrosyl-tRNA(Tyr) deacylase [Pseudomonadota bacterium]
MKAVLQRVLGASVTIDDEVVGTIGRGYVLLLGVEPNDGDEQITWLVDKVLGLRVFANQQGKLDLDIRQVGGSVLLVSQFTLLADTQRGRRPSFSLAAAPAHAESIYNTVATRLAHSLPVQTGQFGADMQVSLVNDGPFTLTLQRDSA